MNKRVSIQELQDYCKKNTFDEIIFVSEDQKHYSVADTCKIDLCFNRMNVYQNPNLVYLKCPSGEICFDRIQDASINTRDTVLGTLIILHCSGCESTGEPGKSYTLIAR